MIGYEKWRRKWEGKINMKNNKWICIDKGRLATSWTIRSSIHSGDKEFSVCQNPSTLATPISFPRVKLLRGGADHLPPPSAEVNRVQLYL